MIKGLIVPVITPGPSLMKDPIIIGWLLLYDYCMTNRFNASSLTDLLNWKLEEDVSFPSEAWRTTFSLLTPAEAKNLIKSYSYKAEKSIAF